MIACCFRHKTPNAHREQLYGSPKAATQPPRLRSAAGAFWSPSSPEHAQNDPITPQKAYRRRRAPRAGTAWRTCLTRPQGPVWTPWEQGNPQRGNLIKNYYDTFCFKERTLTYSRKYFIQSQGASFESICNRSRSARCSVASPVRPFERPSRRQRISTQAPS